MNVAATPSETAGGEPRSVDDWQPRANIKKLFNAGKISLQQQDEITKFSETFYVKREYVVGCVEHLTNLQLMQQIRERTREAEQNRGKRKTCEEYDWLDLVLQGQLNKLKVQELNKYRKQVKHERKQTR